MMWPTEAGHSKEPETDCRARGPNQEKSRRRAAVRAGESFIDPGQGAPRFRTHSGSGQSGEACFIENRSDEISDPQGRKILENRLTALEQSVQARQQAESNAALTRMKIDEAGKQVAREQSPEKRQELLSRINELSKSMTPGVPGTSQLLEKPKPGPTEALERAKREPSFKELETRGQAEAKRQELLKQQQAQKQELLRQQALEKEKLSQQTRQEELRKQSALKQQEQLRQQQAQQQLRQQALEKEKRSQQSRQEELRKTIRAEAAGAVEAATGAAAATPATGTGEGETQPTSSAGRVAKAIRSETARAVEAATGPAANSATSTGAGETQSAKLGRKSCENNPL